MRIERYRDLTIIDLDDEKYLVVACDSCGGVGKKEFDVVRAEPEIVGYYTAYVPLAEVISIKAQPITIIDTLSVEMDNYGIKIVEGIKKLSREAGLVDCILNGSTEENFKTVQTGVGITVIGYLLKKNFPITTHEGDIALIVGIPKVGEEVLEDKGEILTIKKLIEIRSISYVKEILPVGSKGIYVELKEIERANNLKLVYRNQIDIDLKKSGGPSTCAIVTLEEKYLEDFKSKIDIPIHILGRFYKE